MIYAEATGALPRSPTRPGIPVGETQAGRGALPSDHPLALGAIGATGTPAANRLAREADLVIGVGTRWSDFTTASKSAFQDPGVRFVNVNVAALRRRQAQRRCAVEADARAGARGAARGARRPPRRRRVDARARPRSRAAWARRGRAARRRRRRQPLPSQAEVIGAVNEAAGETGVVVCAAGSMPGDLHKLWRARDPKGYHVEYGYSCMGYEIPGGMGVKLAAPEREVFVMIGDGSYLMLPGELVTAVAEGIKLVVVLVRQPRLRVDRRAVAVGRLGRLRHALPRARPTEPAPTRGERPAEPLPIDLAANAEASARACSRARRSPSCATRSPRRGDGGPVVVYVEVDRYAGRAELRQLVGRAGGRGRRRESVRAAREEYEQRARARSAPYVETP